MWLPKKKRLLYTYVLFSGSDTDFLVTAKLYVNYKVSDPESGVDYCEWAIGIFFIQSVDTCMHTHTHTSLQICGVYWQ